MPDPTDTQDLIEEVAEGVSHQALIDQILDPPAEWVDAQGRFFSPWIERGSDGIPRTVPVPTLADMKGMSVGDLASTCERYGYVDSIDARVDMNKEFLRRFNIGEGDPRWGPEMDRLRDKQQVAMLGHTRRLATRHETLRGSGGDLNARFVYINESAEPCDECAPLGGTEMTYREFAENGMLPGDRCLGGDNCLCTLMRVG